MRDAAIAINAAVAQKWPVAADIFKMFQIALADQDLFLVIRGFHNDPPEWIAEKRSAPKLYAFALGAIAANVAELMANAIDHADKNSVGNGMCALDGAPCVVLYRAELGFFVRMPADCRRIKKNVGALQSREASAFRIPLVPANKSSHTSILRVEGLKAKIARSEIKLFIVKRIVRDVHLAIETLGTAIGIKDDRRIVIKATRATFKDRNHYGSFCFPGDSRERFRSWARNGFSQIEKRSVFTLAEILCAEKLR